MFILHSLFGKYRYYPPPDTCVNMLKGTTVFYIYKQKSYKIVLLNKQFPIILHSLSCCEIVTNTVAEDNHLSVATDTFCCFVSFSADTDTIRILYAGACALACKITPVRVKAASANVGKDLFIIC